MSYYLSHVSKAMAYTPIKGEVGSDLGRTLAEDSKDTRLGFSTESEDPKRRAS
jgi:hypothetical protein